ncbi:unnamed protein product, partial [Chrysoparadoxa australica]
GGSDRGVFKLPGQDSNSFWVEASLASVAKNDFSRMQIGTLEKFGRPCRTQVTVLQHGTWEGAPVTKLLMEPSTGRRHQLRLHAVWIGHPILGDMTYSSGDFVGTPRMCLHARSLQL